MSNKDEIIAYSEKDILEMMDDTSNLIVNHHINTLSSAATAAQNSNALTNNVEFWKWMQRNYSNSSIFDSTSSMQEYISKGIGKEEWLRKQLQGKGYEWDWMAAQRNSPKNILKVYDAGDVANRAASDVTEKSIFSKKTTEYQMKAYTSKNNPDLKNTPKDMTVVTNTEKVEIVKGNGYNSVDEFQNKEIIKKATDERLNQIKKRNATPTYNFKNVAGTMAKAGLTGCAIGISTEALISYKSWKSGAISDKEYLTQITKAGGEAGVSASATAGIMIPISSAITAAGASTILTIPIAFVLGSAVNKIVAPCFGRGKYQEILSTAKYYQNVEDVYDNLVHSMYVASEQYYDFVRNIEQQNALHQELKEYSKKVTASLEDLYDSI